MTGKLKSAPDGLRKKQRGLAMIALMTLFALVTSYLIVNGMQSTRAEVTIEQERQSQEALKNAKAALIAYAASKAWAVTGANDQPGALPCPDTNNDGVADSCGATASTRLGRLPWKTMGISDMRDASGEVLWYALSNSFRETGGTSPINSDTEGTLTVTGSTAQTKIVAVIIAPGSPLSGQNRTTNSATNFLESTDTTGAEIVITTKVAPDTWTSKVAPVNKEPIFNDSVVTITQAEIMAVVEPAVASRIEQYIKPYLQTYYNEWGAFPFPAIFSSGTYTTGPGANGTTTTTRGQNYYLGDTTQSSGLLPLKPTNSYSWTSDSDAVALTGGVADSITTESCSLHTDKSSWRCNFDISAKLSTSKLFCGAGYSSTTYCLIAPSFLVSARAGTNVGLSFAKLPSINSVTFTVRTSASGNDPSCTATLSAKTISGTLISTGRGTVNYAGTMSYTGYKSSDFKCRMQAIIPVVVESSLTGSLDADAGWFIKNQWFRQTYYAVSPGYLPGGGASCVAGSTCLTVNNLSSAYLPINNKRAILIFAGRALSGSRPSSSLATYLEGENQTPADRIFAHRDGTASSAVTLNDRAIVISP